MSSVFTSDANIQMHFRLHFDHGSKHYGPWSDCSAILSTFIQLPFVIKIFVLSIFEWPFYTGLTVLSLNAGQKYCWMLQGEHSAILSTFINLPFFIDLCLVYFWLAVLQYLLYYGNVIFHRAHEDIVTASC